MLTMEFFDPCQPFSHATFQSHIQRYAFAAGVGTAKGSVLDIACGSGFGASYLRQCGASLVVGGDLSSEAIQRSRENYKGSNLEFLFLDGSRLPFTDSSFDAVVSFETLEHIPRYDLFVSELHRILKKSGKLVLSTPNRQVFSPGLRRPLRAYHVKEFEMPELTQLLQGNGFAEVRSYGQLYANRISQLRWLLSFMLPSMPGGRLLARLATTLLKDSRLLPADKSIGKSQHVLLDDKYKVVAWRRSHLTLPAIMIVTATAN